MCLPCRFQRGEGVDTGVSGHHAAVISPMPQMVPQLRIPFPRHLPRPLDLAPGSRSQEKPRSQLRKGLRSPSSVTHHRQGGFLHPLFQPPFKSLTPEGKEKALELQRFPFITRAAPPQSVPFPFWQEQITIDTFRRPWAPLNYAPNLCLL